MLRKVKYFQSVIQNNSFSEAAEECHISQSAISQQIQALERELGFQLLERKNRRFTLTPAGEYFYKKSLILVADCDRVCAESAKIARGGEAVLRIGYPRGYSSGELHRALEAFSAKYPEVELDLKTGNHEELYTFLRTESADIVLNDQRRAFSEEYVNLILTAANCCIEIAARNPLSRLNAVTPQDLKAVPCILVCSPSQQETEQEYYRDIVGFGGEFLFAENLEDARLMVVSGKGFMPVEGADMVPGFGASVCRIPLCRGTEPIRRNYCAFWKKDNSGYYVEEFADMLKSQYAQPCE